MIRGIWIVVGSLISGSAFAACATPSGPAYPQICHLAQPYNPNARPYVPPQCTPAGQPPIITDAFDRAHSRVQADLCRLDAIFITNYNIGVRENPADQGRKSYIFLDSNLLNGATLAAEETALQNSILAAYNLGNIRIQYSAAGDNGYLGVVAVMAHEMGHVNWYAKNVRNQACFQQAFMGRSWTGATPNRRWVNFAEATANDHRADPDTHPKKKRLPPGKVRKLHQNFVSVFASVSPEEDYVETYKLLALRSDVSPSLTSLVINANGQDIDVLQNSQQAPISAKLACVRSL
jgi:hypothetical protein